MSMNIGNLSTTSFKDNLKLNQTAENEIYGDGFDLRLDEDNVETLLKNEDDIIALAEAIIEDTGATDLPLADLVLYIKAQAQNATTGTTIQQFMSSVILDLQALAKQDSEDSVLSTSELNESLPLKDLKVNETELTHFLTDVLKSLADSNGKLDANDAPLLAALLGIEEKDAKDFIGTGTTVDKLVDVFSGKDGDISYADLGAIKNS